MVKWNEVKNDPNAIKCLDHGFIVLKDFMGNDDTIVESARVSYGSGTKRVSENRGLIRYLMRHHHWTPFEMVEFRFLVKMPIFVARQFVRHRSACLTGDNLLWFDLPNAISKNKRHRYNVKIEDFYNKWYNGADAIPLKKHKDTYINKIDPSRYYTVAELSGLINRRKETIRNYIRKHLIKSNRDKNSLITILGSDYIEWAKKTNTININIKDRLQNMLLRSCNEQTNEIYQTNIVDIWKNGIKPVFEVELENGYKIKMTKDHLCFTNKGWHTLENAIGLNIDSYSYRVKNWLKNDILFAVNGIPCYQDYNWLNEQKTLALTQQQIGDIAGVSGATIKSWMRKHNIKYTKEEIGKISSRNLIGKSHPRKKTGKLTGIALENVKKSRSGPKSNFWKGGISKNLKRNTEYNNWLYSIKPIILEKYNFSCAITKEKQNLELHHIVPVWMDDNKIMDENNLIPLTRKIHRKLHSKNLEEKFIEWVNNKNDLTQFFVVNNIKLDLSSDKKKNFKRTKKQTKLVTSYSGVKNVRYVGNEMTYDLEVSGPYHNFISNGFVVHNSINEYSGRYSVMSDEFYVPDLHNILPQSKQNNQGRGGNISFEDQHAAQLLIQQCNERSYSKYQILLGECEKGYNVINGSDKRQFTMDFDGIAREIARGVLNVNNYTEWYWKCDLRNIFNFINLRADSHAQYEIQVYAKAMAELIKKHIPLAYEAFEDYILNAENFSRQEMSVIMNLIGSITEDDIQLMCENEKLSAREIKELKLKLLKRL